MTLRAARNHENECFVPCPVEKKVLSAIRADFLIAAADLNCSTVPTDSFQFFPYVSQLK